MKKAVTHYLLAPTSLRDTTTKMTKSQQLFSPISPEGSLGLQVTLWSLTPSTRLSVWRGKLVSFVTSASLMETLFLRCPWLLDIQTYKIKMSMILSFVETSLPLTIPTTINLQVHQRYSVRCISLLRLERVGFMKLKVLMVGRQWKTSFIMF